MNEIQDMFDSALDVAVEQLLCKVVKDKFLEQGINLKEDKVLEIINISRESNNENITFEIDDDSIVSKDNSFNTEAVNEIDLTISEEEIQNITDKVTAGLSKEYPKLIESIATNLFITLKRNAFDEVSAVRLQQTAFESRLEKFWGRPCILFEMYLAIVQEAGARTNESYRKICAKEPNIVLDTLIKLHARASQVAGEILTLMKAGFADGAHARWRTLHEITVVALFIDKHGNDVAERYYFHNYIESYKAALQMQKYSQALGYKPITKKEMSHLKNNYQLVITRFGQDFCEAYGWAAKALGKKKPFFTDIEFDIGLDKLRPYYKMASHNVHANPKGISFKLGLFDKRKRLLLAGASDFGFADPASQTALSLLQITGTLLLTKNNIDSLVFFSILNKFKDIIGKEFLKTQKRYESRYSKYKH